MNIGIFTDTYFPQINGVATSTMILFEELRKNGHNVYIFTPNDVGVDKNERYIYRLPSMKFVFSRNHRMTLMCPPKILLTFRKLKLDIVHTQTEFSMGLLGKMVAEYYDIPLVHTYHTMYEDYVHYILHGHLITKKGAHKFSKVFCNSCDYIITPSAKTKIALEDYGVKKPLSIIPTGLYLDKYLRKKDIFQTLELKKELGILENEKVVLVLGRIAKEKSIDVVINAFSKVINKVDNCKLLIVGDGPYLKELKKMVAKMSISDKVIFAGFVANNIIDEYYKLGDLFITASTSETQGLTYIEAMASSLPVIVKKDLSVTNVVIDSVNGFVFSKDSELPDLMTTLLNNTKIRQRFIDNSLKIVNSYRADVFVKDVCKVYENSIKNYNKNRVKQFFKKTRGEINWKK